MQPRFLNVSAVAVLASALVGCRSGPDRVEVPDFSPEQISERAIEMFDDDGDGSLSAVERNDVKSLDAAMPRLDSDGDGMLTAEEIAARIDFYHEYRAGLVPTYCTLTRAGRPIANAKVTYEPEEFMGESALPAYGTTDSRGSTVISIAEENRQSPAHTGVQPGFYRIRVTLPNGTEVTKFTAGAESAGDLMNNHTFTLP